jgi:hypothetical protein
VGCVIHGGLHLIPVGAFLMAHRVEAPRKTLISIPMRAWSSSARKFPYQIAQTLAYATSKIEMKQS